MGTFMNLLDGIFYRVGADGNVGCKNCEARILLTIAKENKGFCPPCAEVMGINYGVNKKRPDVKKNSLNNAKINETQGLIQSDIENTNVNVVNRIEAEQGVATMRQQKMKGKLCPDCSFSNVQKAICCGKCGCDISSTPVTDVIEVDYIKERETKRKGGASLNVYAFIGAAIIFILHFITKGVIPGGFVGGALGGGLGAITFFIVKSSKN